MVDKSNTDININVPNMDTLTGANDTPIPPLISSFINDLENQTLNSEQDEFNTIYTKKLINNRMNYVQLLSPPSTPSSSSLNGHSKLTEKFVTSTPSNSSQGLENTFKVLEDDLNYRKLSNLTLKQLEYLLNSYKKDKRKLILMNFDVELMDKMTDDQDDDDDDELKSDIFELELEASRRIKEKLDKSDVNNLPQQLTTSPTLSPLKINSRDDLTTLTNQEDIGDYPEYIYHIAKEKNGRLYLKIVKRLLVDKVLCGNRVSQMTKAYDDIEAVTRLLEEKEKDLELTVQIGKELLTQNNRLENRVNDLELNIKKINDNFQQLSHELNQRNEYIAILTNDVDYLNEIETPTTIKTINLDLLQKKIASLQDENKSLRHDTLKLAKETDECEEKEKKLMEDFTYQLHSTNSQFDGLSLELERQKEENNLLQEQLYNLTSRLQDTEMKFHHLNSENEEQTSILLITKENQNLLAGELTEFKIRYQEVLQLLNETQEQLRNARKRSQPNIRNSLLGLPIPQADSLQTELMETSMFSENSVDSGIVLDRLGNGQCTPGFKKVFETIRCVSKANTFADNSNMLHLGTMSYSSSSQPKMSSYIQPESSAGYRSSSVVYSNSLCTSVEGSVDAKIYSRDSVISDLDSNYPGQAPSGCPGAPGAKDLEAALNRLTPAEVLARRAMLSHAPIGTYNYDEGGNGLPVGFRTPDSIMSVGSYSMSTSGLSQHQWRLPEKLQIVKPMEGSQTLRHWNRLATPTLSGLLDERPGVTIRGGKGLDDLGLHLYTLSDCEEDVDDNPGKRFQSSTCVYTYTNSTVMHPDDGTSVISSMPSSQVASRMTSNNVSRQASAPITPRASLSRRNSCSTFSVSLGLASMLNERGIKAVTPSALNTPHGINYTPTVTPCNSPEGGSSSPIRMLSPEPQFLSGLLSSGADLLRRKLIGEYKIRPGNKIMLSRLEKRALKSIKILEKVENMGLESIGSNQGSSSSSSSSASSSAVCPLTLYSSRSSSPMAQLTSFKKFTTNDADEMRIDRETIKAVLSKGFSTESLRSLTDSENSCCSNLQIDNTNKITISNTISQQQQDHPIINTRMKQMQRQKSRRHLKSGQGGQRPDLGTVGNSNSNLIKNKIIEQQQKDTQQSIGFIGTISSLLFGRKGGLL